MTSHRKLSLLACAIVTLAWSLCAQAVYVRHDLAGIGTGGVGLDDYDINGLAGNYPTVGYFWNKSRNEEHCTGTDRKSVV